MAPRTSGTAAKGTSTETPVGDTVGDTLALDAHAATPDEVVGDPKAPLSDSMPNVADPVAAATALAQQRAAKGSSTLPMAGESVVMGADGRGAPIAVSSSPNPTTSAEIQEASALAVLGMGGAPDLVDEAGNPISGDLFVDRYPTSNMVYTTQRVYKTTLMPHSTRPTSTLVYAANVAVPRGEAEQFKKMSNPE